MGDKINVKTVGHYLRIDSVYVPIKDIHRIDICEDSQRRAIFLEITYLNGEGASLRSNFYGNRTNDDYDMLNKAKEQCYNLIDIYLTTLY